jgi:hypothetical protein
MLPDPRASLLGWLRAALLKDVSSIWFNLNIQGVPFSKVSNKKFFLLKEIKINNEAWKTMRVF